MTQEFEKYTESGFGALHMGSQIDDPEAISICFGFKIQYGAVFASRHPTIAIAT